MIENNQQKAVTRKILIISDGFLPPNAKVAGGKSLYLIQKCLSFNKGLEMHLAVFTYKRTAADWREWKILEEKKYNIKFHVFDIPFKGIYPIHLVLTRILSFFLVLYLQTIHKFDLIHEYSSAPFLVNRTYLLGLLTKTKTVHTLCTINNRFLGSVKFLLGSTDKVICTTKNMEDRLKPRFKSKTELIPIPIDDIFYNNQKDGCRADFSIKTNKTVLFCGFLDERKGILCFLNAVPDIIRNNPDASILIVTAPGFNSSPISEQNKKKIFSLIKEYGEKLIFIEREIDMPALLSAVDVHVYPPITMHGTLGTPAILIEGMAFGKAIVASRLPEVSEIIRDGENGLLFNPGDSEDLAKCVNKLLADKELSRGLGEQAKLDSRKYRLSLICDEILKLYNELLSKKPAS